MVPSTFEDDFSEEAQPAAKVTTLSKPHVELETFAKDLTQSLKRVFTTTPRRYDAVHVLLVRWEDHDLGTETDINDLDKIFRETYHYSTECQTIPTDDASNSLKCTVVNFRQKNDSPDNLLIFYYGGHGVGHGAHNAGNESIWTARTTSSVTLNWTDMQPSLLRAQSNVLFLLDCCYASTVGTRDKSCGAKEVIAACSMETGTPGVSDNSFTRQLIEELQQCANKTTTTPQLYLEHDAVRIELRPLRKDVAPSAHGARENPNSSLDIPDLTESLSTTSTKDKALSLNDEDPMMKNRILLAINLKDRDKPPSSQDWLRWLRQGAPENIASIEAMYRADSPQRNSGTDIIQAQVPGSWMESLGPVPGHPDPERPRRVMSAVEAVVRTEGVYDSHSTLLLVSIALPLWTYLPANPAYSFVGLVTSSNRMKGTELGGTDSISKFGKVAIGFGRQQTWYKR